MDRTWHDGLRIAVGDIAVSLVLRELAGRGDNSAEHPNVNRLATLLQRVAERVTDVDDVPLAEFAIFTLDVLGTVGGGKDFALTQEVVDASHRIVERLAAQRRPTTDLLLALARYYGGFNNGGEPRLSVIARAVRASATADELFRALIVSAAYEIDVSRYRRAHEIVDECDRLLRGTDLATHYQADVHLFHGMAYFYCDTARAEVQFRRVVSDYQHNDDLHVRQTVATAHHYLGRIANERGQPREAIAEYLIAMDSENALAGTGYAQLRIAELLLDTGDPTQARDHLLEARRLFIQGRQFSSGEAQLDAAWARYYIGQGDIDRAEKLLAGALALARQDPYPRGEAFFMLQLAAVHIRQRRFRAASPLLIHSVLALRRAEAAMTWRDVFAQVRSTKSYASRLLRVWRGRARGAVRCPCPLHQPVRRTLTGSSTLVSHDLR